VKIGRRVAKIVDNNKNQFTFKLYPPLINATKGIILIEGGNFLEDRTKLEASSKPRHSCTYVLKFIPQCSRKGEDPFFGSFGKFRQQRRPSLGTWTSL
jgi:hypothetical protein